MQLEKWIEKTSTEELRKLAQVCEISVNYLYHVARNGCSAGLAKKIERFTRELNPRRVVRKYELRPDIWKKGE